MAGSFQRNLRVALGVSACLLVLGFGGGGRAASTGSTCSAPIWPGTAGAVTDVELYDLGGQAPNWGCVGGCNGSSASARTWFSPHATLRNAGTADVPWNDWLGAGNAAPLPPYGNRQHPMLVWNLYRIDGEGRLEQIGRSGVKHAYFTVNSGCGCGGGDVLWSAPNTPNQIGCSDTYSAANNNDSRRLGPRSEILPREAVWGRCGSVWDPGCSGMALDHGLGAPHHRMLVRESDLAPALNAGAQYILEAWYLVRDDTSRSNAIRHVRTASTWNGASWGPLQHVAGTQTPGPAIDTWVAAGAGTATSRQRTLVTPYGDALLAVRAVDLGGRWRYDYALLNLDLAHPITSGSEPNLRVIANRGIDLFAVTLGGAPVSAVEFADGAGVAGHWAASLIDGVLAWHAPAAPDTLNWGALFRFSFTSDAPPRPTQAIVGFAQDGYDVGYAVDTLAPEADWIFANGFES